MRKAILTLAAGAAAGFVNGFLGTGGGIVLVYALNYLTEDRDSKDVYAITLTVTLVFSAVSVWVYFRNGSIDLLEGIKYGAAAIPGGLAGAYLLDRLNGGTVKKLFAALLVFAGANMAGIF